MPGISIYLNAEAQQALDYLLKRWHGGQTDKRNATIQRALVELAALEALKGGAR